MRIKALRELNQYTQEQCADMLHMSRSNYAKLENGSIYLTIENLVNIVELYQVSSDFILFGMDVNSGKVLYQILERMKEEINNVEANL